MSIIRRSFMALLFLLASSVNSQAIVNSPASLVECQPAAITWSGASGSVYLSVHEGSDVSSAAVETFPTQTSASGSYTWTVDIAAGKSVTFFINDGTGAENYSSAVTIQSGSDDSCLSDSSSSSSTSIADQSSSNSAATIASAASFTGTSSSFMKASSTSTMSSSTASVTSTSSSSGESDDSLPRSVVSKAGIPLAALVLVAFYL